jgi:hypothetical protein
VEFKNIQRRVYDAVNVLSALEYISKAKAGLITFRGYNKINTLSKQKMDVSHSLSFLIYLARY